jgi:hypothetical protein
VQAEAKVESGFGARLLERLERLEGAAPLGGDLGEREVGAAQLGTERVDPDEDLRDFFVRCRSLDLI